MLIGTVYGYGVRITVCLITLCSSPIVGRWLGDVDCFYFYLPSLLVCCLWCLPLAATPAHGEAVATAELILGKHMLARYVGCGINNRTSSKIGSPISTVTLSLRSIRSTLIGQRYLRGCTALDPDRPFR